MYCISSCPGSFIILLLSFTFFSLSFSPLVRPLKVVRPLKAMNHRINSKKTDYCIDSVVFLEGQEIALILVDRENYSLSNCVFGFSKKNGT